MFQSPMFRPVSRFVFRFMPRSVFRPVFRSVFPARLCVLLPACLLLVAGTVDTARADDALEDAVKARQGYYQMVRHNAGMLFGMAKGDIEYDAETAAAHADNLLKLSTLDVRSLYPAGSSKEEMPGKTRALKKIWDTHPAVLEKSKAWKDAVAAMAAVAGDGVDAVRASAGALGGSCKGCHDEFRAEKF